MHFLCAVALLTGASAALQLAPLHGRHRVPSAPAMMLERGQPGYKRMKLKNALKGLNANVLNPQQRREAAEAIVEAQAAELFAAAASEVAAAASAAVAAAAASAAVAAAT